MQSRVLQFILQSLDANGVPPTLREIAHHFGWRAVGSAQDVIAVLRKKGLLEAAEPGRARQTLPTENAYHTLGLAPRPRLPAGAAASPRRRSAARAERPVFEPALQTLWDAASEPVSETLIGASLQPEAEAELGGVASSLTRRPTSRRGAATVVDDRFALTADAVVVPLLGRVHAGHPAEAISQPDGFVTLPRHPSMRVQQGSLFYALEVEGYSMIGAGMLPGDILLVETQPLAKSGDVAVAAVGPDQDVTVKRFALKGSPLYRSALTRTSFASGARETWPPALLIPENEDFDPIPFGVESTDRIVGLVRSLFRPELR